MGPGTELELSMFELRTKPSLHPPHPLPRDILWTPGGHCYLWQGTAGEGITNGKSGNEII